MKINLENYIIELESKIQILERENEALSAKAEENLLLNRAFEEINDYSDIDCLLTNTLESISVIMNIQFSGIFDLTENTLQCKNSYALFSNEDTTEVYFEIRGISGPLESVSLIHYPEFVFKYPNHNFLPYNALVIPFYSEMIQNRYFVFVNDSEDYEIADRIPVFEKIIRIISAKLDKLYYQNELINLNEELEEKIERRTLDLQNQNSEYAALNEEYKKINEELKVSKEKAEESDRLKTAFLQNMSHEIRTPMNAIIGFSSLLAETYDNREKLEQFTNIIGQRCNDLLDIINDILDISKIESGQVDLHLTDCPISEIFSELRTLFFEYQNRMEKQNIRFSIDCFCETNNYIIKTDKVKLKQILINLITNAFKFTEQGQIQCGCKSKDGKLVFFVSDTGIGIPTDKHELIFERFSQLNQLKDQCAGGTGLGLSIVKALINLMGGEIWLESEIGRGSTFYFYLKQPEIQTIEERIPEPKKKNIYWFENRTILIVEDDFYNSSYLRELLSRYNFKVLTAYTGAEGIKIAIHQPIDLILMDIRLPDYSGYEAAARILESKPLSKIIAQTAYAAYDEHQKAINTGCVDYISKPIRREELMGLLNKHL